MKPLAYAGSIVLAFALGGCIVAPVGHPHAAPAGVVYVGPTYPAPGVGFVWAHHVRFGWGWHHARHGWHRGWH